MNEIFHIISLFYPQIIIGCVLGVFLSILGILLVLRNLTFFGLTLSQAVSFSVALSLFLDWQSDFAPMVFSCILILPIIWAKNLTSLKEDVVLGILFVLFSSFSQILLSLGGNVQNHLLASFFGDILTSQVKLSSWNFLTVCLAFFLYLSFFRRFLFISFDRDHYQIQVGNPLSYDIFFYFILTLAITVTVNLLGSFYSIAHLLIPMFTFYAFSRSLKVLALLSAGFSFLSTLIGFSLSLTGIQVNGTEVYFPTSSLIILFMGTTSFLILLFRRIFLPT
nr:metal ABC transporter permease [Leptospira ryugenii]